MAQNTSSVPSDLASILATLSQFAAPVQSYNTASDVVIQQDVRKDSDYDPYDAYEPPALEASRQLSESRTPQSQPSVIDPATITEWSAGLRCVSKVAAQNRQFADTIKRMIHNQRTHEMQWYASRQALKQDQAKRGANTGALQSILKSVGGSAIDDSHTPQTQEEKIVELKAFDVKIYKAQIQMDQAMTAELKSLGVPFFGTRLDCIRSIDEETIDEEGVRQKWSPLVTSQDLTELQRRMINYLEDMYKE